MIVLYLQLTLYMLHTTYLIYKNWPFWFEFIWCYISHCHRNTQTQRHFQYWPTQTQELI